MSNRKRKQKKQNEFKPGTFVLSLMPAGTGGCQCPICEVLGIEGGSDEPEVVCTPIETAEQWEALQAAYAAVRSRLLD